MLNSLKCKSKTNLVYLPSFGLLPFVFGGLTDSVNPCALTIAVFFIVLLCFFSSYPKFLIGAGGAFILGVFLACFFSSLGIWDIVRTSSLFFLVCRISYLVIASLILVVAVLSMKRWWEDKKNVSKNTARTLFPWDIKILDEKNAGNKLNFLRDSPAFVFFFSFLLGVALTLLGSVCPEQINVSVIVYALMSQLQISELLSSLLVYSLCFIVPLIFIWLFALVISNSNRFKKTITEHLGTVKVIYCAVLFAIGLGLIYTFL